MFENVVVAGSGTLGSQIAFQTAFKGFEVTIYDINDEALQAAKSRIETLKKRYLEEIQQAQSDYVKDAKNIRYNTNLLPNLKSIFDQNVAASLQQVEDAAERIRYSSDLATAVEQAQLVIEAIPEVVKIKADFYEKLGKVAPAYTIFATNSSTLLPSQFAEITGRPTQFLALHFANEIWRNNTAEVMGHEGTDPKVYEQVVEFAKQIGMIPIRVKKETSGYVLNSILGPLLNASIALVADGVADPETVDRTWMLATGAPSGPMAIMDVIGMQTHYNVDLNYWQTTGQPIYKKVTDFLKAEYIDKGKLGIYTGEGFYKYPHPAFEAPDFLHGETK